MSALRQNRRKDGCEFYLDLSAPSHAQLSSAVKGSDRNYRIKVKRTPYWLQQLGYALLVLFLLFASFGSWIVISEFVESVKQEAVR